MITTLIYLYVSYIWQIEANRELFAYISSFELFIVGISMLTAWLEMK